MVVELRKRKAPAAPPAQQTAPKKRASRGSASTTTKKTKAEPKPKPEASAAVKAPSLGKTIDLDSFQDEITLQDGTATSLKALVDQSESGVVLFTYPRASTPGCTNQACLFRDNYEALTSTGLSVYGLSADSPKANTTFQTKQNLQYSLLCDPSAKLIGALGLKKIPNGTARGVFAVNKDGKVLLIERGGPAATLASAKGLIEE